MEFERRVTLLCVRGRKREGAEYLCCVALRPESEHSSEKSLWIGPEQGVAAGVPGIEGS